MKETGGVATPLLSPPLVTVDTRLCVLRGCSAKRASPSSRPERSPVVRIPGVLLPVPAGVLAALGPPGNRKLTTSPDHAFVPGCTGLIRQFQTIDAAVFPVHRVFSLAVGLIVPPVRDMRCDPALIRYDERAGGGSERSEGPPSEQRQRERVSVGEGSRRDKRSVPERSEGVRSVRAVWGNRCEGKKGLREPSADASGRGDRALHRVI